MSKEELSRWKTKEKELLAEIITLQKNIEEITRSVRTKDQQIDKLKSTESKQTGEVDILRNKVREVTKKDDGLRSRMCCSVDNFMRLEDCDNIPTKYTSTRIRREELPDNCLNAFRCEKWLGVKGGVIKLPQLTITTPPQTLDCRVLITAIKTEISQELITNIKQCRLGAVVQPVLLLSLEPGGTQCVNEVSVDLHSCINNPRYRYLVFQKDTNCYNNTEWTEVTHRVNPKFLKGSVLRLLVNQFAKIAVLRIDVPVTSFIANNNLCYSSGPVSQQQTNTGVHKVYQAGINTAALVSLLNANIKWLIFHIYHDIKNKNLNIWAKEVFNNKRDTDTDQVIPDSHTLMFINKLPAKLPLCLHDRVYFHFDGHKKWQEVGVIDFQEVGGPRGQLFKVALGVKKAGPPGAPVIHQEKMPRMISVTRRVADRLDSQEVCSLNIQEVSLSTEYHLAAITQHVIDKVLARVRIRIMRTVDIRQVVETLRRSDVLTALEQDQVNREKTPYTRAKIFMDYLARKGARGMVALCQALETDYVGLAHEIRAILQCHV